MTAVLDAIRRDAIAQSKNKEVGSIDDIFAMIDEMVLDEPSIVKQGSRYGIKLRALAPSIHMIKVDVESTFEPIIGTEEQSNKLLEKIMSDYESDHNSIWSSEIFGRKLKEV